MERERETWREGGRETWLPALLRNAKQRVVVVEEEEEKGEEEGIRMHRIL